MSDTLSDFYKRLEPQVNYAGTSTESNTAIDSIAISMKRIADALEGIINNIKEIDDDRVHRD